MKIISFKDLKPLSDEEILVVLKQLKKNLSVILKTSPCDLYFLCIAFGREYLDSKKIFVNSRMPGVTGKIFPQLLEYKPKHSGYSWFDCTKEGNRKRMELLNLMIKDYTKKIRRAK